MRLAVPTLILLATAAHAGARPVVRTNACQVLTKTEVIAVQGEPYTDTKLTSRGNNSQCFYQLPSFTKSVSVDVIREDARAFWRQRFERSEEREERDRQGKREEDEESPLRVPGLGEEAFWAGNRMAGSLYVLRGDAVLRVSVGGAGTESQKIARSKKLAAKALRRL